MRKGVAGLVLLLLGAPTVFLGLVRLGWRRHGAPATDLGFLHLDWAADPSLPWWRAHVENLCLLAGGLLAACVGVVLVVRQVRAARGAARGGAGAGASAGQPRER